MIELREQVEYDAATGNFFWKVTKRGLRKGTAAAVYDKFAKELFGSFAKLNKEIT